MASQQGAVSLIWGSGSLTEVLWYPFSGWKFWVPAASINFYAVPLQMQVGDLCEVCYFNCVI